MVILPTTLSCHPSLWVIKRALGGDELPWIWKETDWNGDEVGFPDIPGVSLDSFDYPSRLDGMLYQHIDTETVLIEFLNKWS